MKIKRIIMNLLGIKPKRRRTKSKRKSNSTTSGNTKKTTKKSDYDGPVFVSGKYDTKLLRKQVSETEYISNLRIGRSWILPQLVQMGFKRHGLSKNFDLDFFENNLNTKYNKSPEGRREIWTLMKRNFKVIAITKGSSKRSSWWTKEVLADMLKWDFSFVGKRSKGLNRKECFRILNSIEKITDYQQMYEVVEAYDAYRMKRRQVYGNFPPLPKSFLNAFMADGAYHAMMTMVKVLGIRMKDENGNLLTRDECINRIEAKSDLLDGRELLEYCKDTFFDSGAFKYWRYVRYF